VPGNHNDIEKRLWDAADEMRANSKLKASPKAFLSYAHEDELAARRLCSDLKNAGVKPWLDKDCLLPGQKWDFPGHDIFIALCLDKRQSGSLVALKQG